MKLAASVDRAMMLRFLGYRGQAIDGSLTRRMEEVAQRCEREFLPRGSYRLATLQAHRTTAITLALDHGELVLPSYDLAQHLRGVKLVALMACTLGLESERMLRRAQHLSLTDAVLLDAAASALIEDAANQLQAIIEATLAPQGLHARSRFSPGYGDLELSVQQDLLTYLDAGRQLGISLNDELLMTPAKSITAILGFSPSAHKLRLRGPGSPSPDAGELDPRTQETPGPQAAFAASTSTASASAPTGPTSPSSRVCAHCPLVTHCDLTRQGACCHEL